MSADICSEVKVSVGNDNHTTADNPEIQTVPPTKKENFASSKTGIS